jgi:hypothetical protein
MIELTDAQVQAVKDGETVRIAAGDAEFVIVRADLYERMRDYDDSPWTDEEMDLLAAEVDAMLDDDMCVKTALP